MVARSYWLLGAYGLAVVLLAGCGSTSTTAQSPSPGTSAASGVDESPATASQAAPPANSTVVDVTIADGAVTPTNGQVQGAVGAPIVLWVNSDAVDKLHVHSVPERTFQVAAGPGQRFEFTVDVPGQVAVELHDLNRTVVTVQVRP